MKVSYDNDIHQNVCKGNLNPKEGKRLT